MTQWWRRITRALALALALGGSILSGCESPSNDQGRLPRPQRPVADSGQPRTRVGQYPDDRQAPATEGRGGADRGMENRSAVMTRPARAYTMMDRDIALSPSDAIQRVLNVLRDSVAFAPTTVVWLVDISRSAMSWGSEIHNDIRCFYEDEVPALCAGRSDQLQTGIMTISETVAVHVKRTADSREVMAAFDGLRIASSGREITFETVRQALAEYLPQRIREHREVMFVIISDEAGDDWREVDQLIEQPRKYALPIYVVGVPAPLGRTAALDPGIESSPEATDSPTLADRPALWQPILQGPESREPEMIQLELEEVHSSLELLDSGFGPFALEWLCRATGGAYFAVRVPSTATGVGRARRQQWPTVDAGIFDTQRMRSYAPDGVDAASYQDWLQNNAACRALHDAARLPRAAVLRDAEFRFEKRDEADLKSRLDRAQQAAAKVAPAVNQLYEILGRGAEDAATLTRPRWKAGYDLALGRSAAAKARIDGYNAMLAALKRGRTFTRPDSRFWVLERAPTTLENSSLQNLINRAQSHLQRVLDEHHGTPWAKIAQYELETPMGWQWTEEPGGITNDE
ncbi:MAG: vWA domain-containing protein [Pirellulaceae bacterium]